MSGESISEEEEKVISELNHKSFDLSILSTKLKNITPEQKAKLISGECTIPYSELAKYVEIDKKFMTREELSTLKLFPVRNWCLPRRTSENDIRGNHSNSSKCKIIFGILLVILLVSAATTIYFMIIYTDNK